MDQLTVMDYFEEKEKPEKKFKVMDEDLLAQDNVIRNKTILDKKAQKLAKTQRRMPKKSIK